MAAAWLGASGKQRLAGRVGQQRARFEQYRRRPRDVTQRCAIIVDKIESTQGDIAQMEGRRPEATHTVAPHPLLDVLGHAIHPRRARGEEGGAGRRLAGHAKWPVVEPRTSSDAPAEEPARHRVVDRASKRHPAPQHADGHGEARHPAREVAGVVERTKHPRVARRRADTVVERRPVPDKPVARKQSRDLAPEPVMDGDVGVAHGGAGARGALRAVKPLEGEAPAEDGQVGGEPGARLTADPLVGAHVRCPPSRTMMASRVLPRDDEPVTSRHPHDGSVEVASPERIGSESWVGGGGCVASVNRTVVPSPSWLSMASSPPCASTRCFTMASPSPVPPSSRERALSTR